MIHNLITKIKLLNRKRLKRSRINKLLKTDPSYRESIPHPNKIKTILFMEAQEGWGDFLYFNGLLKSLHDRGITIDVASLRKTFNRYNKLDFIRDSFPLGDPNSVKEISSRTYDLAIDVTYVNSNYWELRRVILSSLHCHTITTSDIASSSKLFDNFIDLGTKCHWSQRNALIYNEILRPHAKKTVIPPFYPTIDQSPCVKKFLESLTPNKSIVYINTKAGAKPRTLSEEQTKTLIDLFNQRQTSIGVFFTDFEFTETLYVRKLPKLEFDEFTSFIQHTQAIITPDTSAVHLGSAFNIPVFGIYCGNNRDYWSKFSMQDVWAPLSVNSYSYFEDDPGATSESDFIYAYKKKSISTYNSNILCEKILQFLTNLHL